MTFDERREKRAAFDEAVSAAGRDERFMATVYAINTLLLQKGIYTAEEYRALFVEWVEKERRKGAVRLDPPPPPNDKIVR